MDAFNTGSKCQCMTKNSMKITTVLDVLDRITREGGLNRVIKNYPENVSIRFLSQV